MQHTKRGRKNPAFKRGEVCYARQYLRYAYAGSVASEFVCIFVSAISCSVVCCTCCIYWRRDHLCRAGSPAGRPPVSGQGFYKRNGGGGARADPPFRL